MKTGKVLSQEESTKDAVGKTKCFNAFKAPLQDDTGDVVGLVGTLVDTTAEKEAENLKIEIEGQKIAIQAATEASHDIRSPARTVYSMIDSAADRIPEDIRVPVRATVASIIDIANSFIDRIQGKFVPTLEEQKPIIASLDLMQILGEKRYQHTGSPINFTEDYASGSKLVFIKVQQSHFKRMISNLLNNAIEALEGKKGSIHLGLGIDDMKKDVKITIQDTGKGMPKEIVDKIKSGAAVATDKKEGHGIGLTQIREAIERNWGKFDVISTPGEGTKMIVIFPITVSPEWLAKDIKLNKGDTVTILDDDPSIHVNWDTHFKKHTNDVQLKHFIIGKEAIEFINTFPEKNKLYLLTDYELMKQGMTGIDVIKQTDIKRATLVTSHYDEVGVQKLVAELGVGILPKDLAMEVSIEICDNEKCAMTSIIKIIAMVIVEDNEMMRTSTAKAAETKGKNADTYGDPDNFLKNAHKYDKNVIMLIDHEFNGSTLNGFDVLKQLHELGFTRLYLFSGRRFEENEVPDYVTVIMKTDIDGFMKLFD